MTGLGRAWPGVGELRRGARGGHLQGGGRQGALREPRVARGGRDGPVPLLPAPPGPVPAGWA
eukprot:5062974-Lingulodinium_polyedra.AAC.1